MIPNSPHAASFLVPKGARLYRPLEPLVLVNGLAEQSESWFANRRAWGRSFDLKVPELLVYNGESLHRHVGGGGLISVDYLADRLSTFLDEYVQKPPYHFVGSSLGGMIVLTYAERHPEKVGRVVLIGPSGFHGEENLPMMEGVRRSQYDSLVRSVFFRPQFANEELIRVIERKFQDRLWKRGVLNTLRGTVGHSVGGLLERVSNPCLILWGEQDRVIADVPGSIEAAQRIPGVLQVLIPRCGHAPQIEEAGLVNGLVSRFLKGQLKRIPPKLDAVRQLRRRSLRPVV